MSTYLPIEDRTPYPRKIGDIIIHPLLPNTVLEVTEVWDTSQPFDNQKTFSPFDYGSQSNRVVDKYNNPAPRRDTSKKHPIYKCRVNGVDEQWVVFDWIVLSDKKPNDLLTKESLAIAQSRAEILDNAAELIIRVGG